ncbi:MAG: hypothetical protein HYX48_07550 [Chlamydiales bacterium]|nr:hypothetical protein [Chlamydiales bacterium]
MTNAIGRFSLLPAEDCGSIISSFLTDEERATTAPVCRGMQAFFGTVDSVFLRHRFLEVSGALTPTESASPSFDTSKEYRFSQQIRKLPEMLEIGSFAVLDGNTVKIQRLDRAGFFTQLAYYSGYYQESLAQGFTALSAERVSQTDEFLAAPAPTTLISLRNTCIRVQNFSKEMMSMFAAHVKGQDSLDKARSELWFLARYICQFVQWLMQLIMGTADAKTEILTCYIELTGTDLKVGKLENLSKGRFQGAPEAHIWGVRIGETPLTVPGHERTLGIYAYPETIYRNAQRKFTGEISFALSEDGQGNFGYLKLNRYWNRGSSLFFDEGSFGVEQHNERNLTNRRLDTRVPKFASDQRSAFGDRHIMRKLIQLLVEISHREGGEKLTLINIYDQAYSFTAAGFDTSSHIKPRLLEKIQKARAEGKKFPDPDEEGTFELWLDKPKSGTMLDVEVDFGEGPTTWGKIIQAAPMLPGEGRILPRYWKKDLFPYEASPKPAATS